MCAAAAAAASATEHSQDYIYVNPGGILYPWPGKARNNLAVSYASPPNRNGGLILVYTDGLKIHEIKLYIKVRGIL